MSALAIIPARGGSKGIPGKNLRLCAGRPLLAWSIEAALQAQLVTRVVVSSDSDEILDVAQQLGAEALRRPAELATDEAATDPVLVHVVETLGGGYDLVVLLQPTVPYRRPGLVDECIQRVLNREADSLLTAYPAHFVWWREHEYITGAGPDPKAWRSQCPRRPRRQDMTARELMFLEDGAVYVTQRDLLLQTHARLGGRIEVLENGRSVDVDTEEDLAMAEALLLASRKEAACESVS